MWRLVFVAGIFFHSCKTATTYYVVRHAEKEAGTTMTATTTMTSDVPLSAEGKERAEDLKNRLMNQRIEAIYATNTIRAKSTAQPLSEVLNIPIHTYDHRDTTFLASLNKSMKNSLIVGHSNTIDDIVNTLSGRSILQDLSDSAYGDLFLIKKRGDRINFTEERFGK